jgi:hypothetical protein
VPPNPTRFKFDVTGVESAKPVLPAGVYVGKITQADITEPDGKDMRIELVVTVRHEKKDYPLYEYVNLVSEDAKWKLRELLEAVSLVDDKKGAGSFDTKKDLVGKAIGVRTTVRPANEQYDESSRIRRMFAPDSETTSSGAEDLDDAEAEDGTEAEGEATPYDDWTLAQLRKEARERGIKTVRMGAEDIINALLDSDEADGGAAEEEEPEAEEEAEAIDVMGMPIAELKVLAREHGVKVAGKKPKELREELDALVNAPAEEEEEELAEEEEELVEEEDGEEEAAPSDDYDEWEVDDLRIEAKDRSLSDRGGKPVLIARLRRDDAEGDNPF